MGYRKIGTIPWMSGLDATDLVCEGRCNLGRVETFDALVRDSMVAGQPILTDRTLALGRSLVHTPHVRAGRDYVCQHCGTNRRWGA